MSAMRFDRLPVTLLFCTLALASCGKTLDTAKIEDTIRGSVVDQGGTSLKSVICPSDIKPMPGQSFECVGVLESGAGVAIAVTQQDDQGNVQWDVPSVKGLLNMSKLQAVFQEGLQKAGGQVRVDCGSNPYRPAKPGEIFDCKVLKQDNRLPGTTQPAPTAKLNQPDTIQVKVDLSGDVSWQPIVPVQVAQSSTLANNLKTASGQPAPVQPEKAASPASPAPDSRSAAPPAEKSAEDFLNQPGAADDFN